MALVVVLSVMNGFQGQFINAIMEINSYHVRVQDLEDEEAFVSWAKEQKSIVSVTPFHEAQGLMVGSSGKQSAAIVRSVPEDVMFTDAGFCREMNMISGTFDLTEDDFIVLGYDLARSLGVTVGGTVNILALSGASDVSLLSNDRVFTVAGIFWCGYSDINSTYSFIRDGNSKKIFGRNDKAIYGLKLRNSSSDRYEIGRIQKAFPSAEVTGWQTYNRSFFGALRIEKNLLMLMVLLIFLVVGVNIYNGMRRMVFERKEDIAVLSALGARKREVQSVFIAKGLLTGLKGSVPGIIAGIFLCINIDKVFMLVSKIQYFAQYFVTAIFSPENVYYVAENSMFSVYAGIPARMVPSELLFVFFFGLFSSVAASWFASSNVLKLTISEIIRDE